MDLLLIAHLVAPYDEWKAVFDGDAEVRAQFMSGEVLVGQADETTAMVVAYGVDLEAMAEFMGAPEFAERTAQFVSHHTIYNLSEVAPPQ